jgi:MFS transporter, ACS family, hexuronate transporter
MIGASRRHGGRARRIRDRSIADPLRLGYGRRVLSRRQAWKVAIVATLTMTVSYFDRQTLSVLAPEVTKALDISDEAYGWLSSAFSMAYLLATPLSGWWIDRAGARRGLVASVLAWTIVAALHAVVPGFAMLFVFRLLLGITEGPGFPGAAQTMQRVLPASDRERGFGVLFTGSSLGGMLVPPFAIFIFNLAGWRAAFLVTALAGLVWIPLWLWVTRSSEVRAQLAVALPSEAAPRPGFLELVRHPLMLRAFVAVLAAAPVFGFPQVWGAKYLVHVFRLEQGDIGKYLWLPPLMFDAGVILFGDLASRQRRAEGVPPRGLFALALVLAATLGVLPFAATPWQATLVCGVAVAGSGAMYTLVTADLLGRMPIGSVSFASGILAGAQSVALIIGNPLIGRMVDKLGDYAVPSFVIALWAIPGAVVWLVWRPAARFVPRGAAHTTG